MIPITDSYLSNSPQPRTPPLSQNWRHNNHRLSLVRDQNQHLEDEIYLKSVTKKVEPLDVDKILKECLEDDRFQEEESTGPPLSPHQPPSSSSAHHHNHLPSNQSASNSPTSNGSHSNGSHNASYPDNGEQGTMRQSQKQAYYTKEQMMKVTRMYKDVQKSASTLQQEVYFLQNKLKTLHAKVENQYAQIFRSEIEGLKAELSFENDKWMQEKSDLERTIRQLDTKNKKLQKKILKTQETTKHDEFSKTNIQQNNKIKENADKLQWENAKLKEEIQKFTKLHHGQNSSGQKHARQMEELEIHHQRSIARLEAQVKEEVSRAAKLHTARQDLQQQLLQAQEKIKQLKSVKLSLELQLQNAIVARKQSQSQLQKLGKIHEALIREKEQFEKEAAKHINELQHEMATLEADAQLLKRQHEVGIQHNAALKNQIETMQKQMEVLKRQQEDSADEIDRLTTELKQYKSENRELFNFKRLVTNNLPAINEQLQVPANTNQISQEYFNQIVGNIERLKYFQDSQILSAMRPFKKEFVMNVLKQFLRWSSFKTHLLYRFDPLNTVNFHNYFDRKKNVLILIELANGTVLAGFSAYPYDPQRTEKPGSGLLLSITDEKVYRQRSDPKQPVAPYDTYFYLLGNAELRLKTQERKLFSNFGIANSTFQNGRDLRTQFLKVSEPTNNELEINTYEFYQIQELINL